MTIEKENNSQSWIFTVKVESLPTNEKRVDALPGK